MTIIELINATGSLPDRAMTKDGVWLSVEVEKNMNLGYVAYLWELNSAGAKIHVVSYGTGNTSEAAKEALKKKLLTPTS